jgi:phosphoglycerol transferase MdoB-like AlkP superfamily enzyme
MAMSKLFEKSRFSLILLFLLINLTVFALLRMALLVKQLPEIDSPFYQLVLAFCLGIVNDLAFYSYVLIPFVLYLLILPDSLFHSNLNKRLVYAGFFIHLYLLFFIETAEWTFWDEFGVRFNFIAVDYLVYTHEVVGNIVESYPLGWILTGILILSIVCFILMKEWLFKCFHARGTFSSRLKIAALLLSFPILSYAVVGQAWHQFSANTYLNEISANGPYQFFAAFRNNELDYRHFYRLGEDRRLSDIIRAEVAEQPAATKGEGLYDIKRIIKQPGAEKHLNVILITVESLSAEFLAAFGNSEQLTPFLDEWMKQGLLFTNFYATGTRTIRGLEALTLSIPPTPGQSIIKRPDNGKLFNLGRVFQQRGYDTAFLYGGRGYFDNMNSFFSGNGYWIIDQTEFTPEEITFANAWGVSDDIIFKRTIKEADNDYRKDKPFFFQIMTTSNHRPYTYPDGKIDIPSGTGRTGGIKYTDYALGEFIRTAKGKPWFDDTIFVMVADHCAGSARKVDLPVDRYHIPLFIYAPKYVKPDRNNILSSQIDVAPTILALLNFSYESRFYGRNILQMPRDEGRALISNYQKLGLFKDNKLVILSPQQKIEVIADPLGAHKSLAVSAEPRMILEEMAYYQSADYIWTHRLSRYQ